MTNVVFPPNTTIYPEKIEINGGEGAPGVLDAAELYIDEVNRVLYTETGAGVSSLPLDVVAVPRRPSETDPSAVLLKTLQGAEWGLLSAGGGGAPFDAAPWRVPGVAPASLGSLVFPAASGGIAVFEIGLRVGLQQIRVHASAGAGAVDFALHAYDGGLGAQLGSTSLIFFSPGDQDAAFAAPLEPGLYAWTWASSDVVTLSTIEGFLSWSSAKESHPVSMKLV